MLADIEMKMYSLKALLLMLLGNTAQADTENPTLNGSIFALIQELQQKLENQKIAFTAKSSADITTNIDETIILNDVFYQQGNGYNPVTGLFTAPVSGTYLLMLDILCKTQSANRVSVMKGDIVICTAYGQVQLDVGTCHAIQHLKAGDVVRLNADRAANLIYAHTQWSVFIINVE